MYAIQYSAISSGPYTNSFQSPLLPEPTITGRYNNQWEGQSRHLPNHDGNKPPWGRSENQQGYSDCIMNESGLISAHSGAEVGYDMDTITALYK